MKRRYWGRKRAEGGKVWLLGDSRELCMKGMEGGGKGMATWCFERALYERDAGKFLIFLFS